MLELYWPNGVQLFVTKVTTSLEDSLQAAVSAFCINVRPLLDGLAASSWIQFCNAVLSCTSFWCCSACGFINSFLCVEYWDDFF